MYSKTKVNPLCYSTFLDVRRSDTTTQTSASIKLYVSWSCSQLGHYFCYVGSLAVGLRHWYATARPNGMDFWC